MTSTVVCVPESFCGSGILRWKTRCRQALTPSAIPCTIETQRASPVQIHSPGYGWVIQLASDGATVTAGCKLFAFEPCTHHIVMKDLCAECGANLRRQGGGSGERVHDASASIPMVHAIPDLHVSESIAAELAWQDQQSLLLARKLVLLVDLDETLLHTTNDSQAFKYKDVHRYRLPGSPLVYHTSFRPHLHSVLERLSKYYQMHICTFGNRVYAHQLASMIDPEGRYFAHRILSRDECFDPATKSANLRALFPRGLNLVCIIDDRGEVWDWSPHLIQVKPYRFFEPAGDLNKSPSPDIVEHSSRHTEKESPKADPPVESTTETLDNSIAPTQPEDELEVVSIPMSDNQTEVKDAGASSEQPSEASPAPDSPDASPAEQKEQNNVPAEHESLHAPIAEKADGNYLLRLQDILIGLHRAYYMEYDRWYAAQIAQSDDENGSKSPSISSSQSSHPHTPMEPPPTSSSEPPEVPTALPNLASIIAQHRAAVLGPTCHITLSGLTPYTHLPELCFAGRVVRSLGAILHGGLRLPPATEQSNSDSKPSQSTMHTTHLVACRRGTEKYNAASKFVQNHPDLSVSFHIVSPEWLWACHFNWEHMPESEFPLVHDFHPSDFDPEAEPVPGTWRYRRYVRRNPRHAAEHSPVQTHRASPGTFRYHVHKERPHHRRHHHHRHHRRRSNSSENENGSTSVPRLDVSVVQSAWESIREELSSERKRKHRSRHPADDEDESTTALPKREKLAEEDVGERSCDDLTVQAGSSSSTPTANPEAEPSNEIRDTGDEEGFAENLERLLEQDRLDNENNEQEEGVDESTEDQSDSESGLETDLNAFLPPPKPLILADNPLMHLPPQATSEMLAEIEDAVIEEAIEKISSVPPEAELYNPTTLGLNDTDSSESSEPDQMSTRAVMDVSSHRKHHNRIISAEDADSSRKALQWQIKRELLVRRRLRASPSQVRRIDKKLQRLDAKFRRREELRQRSMDDLFLDGAHRHRQPVSRDSESEEEDDIWDEDYPKGWGPNDQQRRKSPVPTRHHRRSVSRSVSLSPAIHSDPEFSDQWWQSIEDLDYRDWNTCPEGYDYADAEQTRALLGRDRRASELRSYAGKLHGTHSSLINCLFGDDEDAADDDSSSASSEEANDEDSDDPAGPEDDLNDERWQPLREFM